VTAWPIAKPTPRRSGCSPSSSRRGGRGVGEALVERCLELARQAGRRQVVIHSSEVMTIAWRMYDKLGFVRAPDLDFMQDTYAILGFAAHSEAPRAAPGLSHVGHMPLATQALRTIRWLDGCG